MELFHEVATEYEDTGMILVFFVNVRAVLHVSWHYLPVLQIGYLSVPVHS